MFTYDAVKDKSDLLKAMTGLSAEELGTLLEAFTSAWEDYSEAKSSEHQERQRAYGGGRRPVLRTTEHKLLFILYYLKVYPLQEILAFEFGMSQSQACEWIHVLCTVLRMALTRLGHIPERVPERLAAMLERSGEETFAVDGTERRRQRPKNDLDQRQYYSGKKKTHTFKNIVIVTLEGRLVKYLSDTYEGKKHDKKICDEEEPTFPEGSTLYQDTGFQGYAPLDVQIRQPKKKPRGRKLTEAEREQNRLIARIRIIVEHVLGGVKRLRIVKDVFRNWTPHFDHVVIELACALHNFRANHRYQGGSSS